MAQSGATVRQAAMVACPGAPPIIPAMSSPPAAPSPLLAILRQALAERPDGVEVLVRFRREPRPAC